eukprot:m.255204 g.255204  ORF g.255204 m.255204 type:complete len:89 (+) comp40393_c0_seq14:3111-3377(+)
MIWKFITLHFFAYRHPKYALEGLILQARLGFTLSPRKAEQLKWNWFTSPTGGAGKNKPLDLSLRSPWQEDTAPKLADLSSTRRRWRII